MCYLRLVEDTLRIVDGEITRIAHIAKNEKKERKLGLSRAADRCNMRTYAAKNAYFRD